MTTDHTVTPAVNNNVEPDWGVDAKYGITNVEKGVFTAVSVTRNQPAYFIFVLIAIACLGLRLALHDVPQFVETSSGCGYWSVKRSSVRSREM